MCRRWKVGVTMTQKKEMPARSGNYEASTNPNKQLHNSATSWKKQVKLFDVTEIVERIRRHETSTGQKWPGQRAFGDPAFTRYPRLAAEIEASQKFLWCPADHAAITEEVLADVLESGEALSFQEAARLCRFFECGFEYLFGSWEIPVVDTRTHKGVKAMYRLYKALEHCIKVFDPENRLEDPFCRSDFHEAVAEFERMNHREVVTYARFRKAMQNIESVEWCMSAPTVRGREVAL